MAELNFLTLKARLHPLINLEWPEVHAYTFPVDYIVHAYI